MLVFRISFSILRHWIFFLENLMLLEGDRFFSGYLDRGKLLYPVANRTPIYDLFTFLLWIRGSSGIVKVHDLLLKFRSVRFLVFRHALSFDSIGRYVVVKRFCNTWFEKLSCHWSFKWSLSSIIRMSADMVVPYKYIYQNILYFLHFYLYIRIFIHIKVVRLF